MSFRATADSLYVGTASGRILSFRVTATAAAGGRVEYTATSVAIESLATSRPVAITQLEALGGDVSQLLAVAGDAIFMLDLLTLKRRPSGGLDSKSVAYVAVNRGRVAGGRAGSQKLCVVTTRKRLRLFAWAIGGKQFSYVTELDVPELPRAVAYYGMSLICGYAREYNIISEE